MKKLPPITISRDSIWAAENLLWQVSAADRYRRERWQRVRERAEKIGTVLMLSILGIAGFYTWAMIGHAVYLLVHRP